MIICVKIPLINRFCPPVCRLCLELHLTSKEKNLIFSIVTLDRQLIFLCNDSQFHSALEYNIPGRWPVGQGTKLRHSLDVS